jgi:glycosyltransferase involved in cell wall biosynthesis
MKRKTLVILSPAFAAHEQDSWLPSQEVLIRALNRNFPLLNIVILSFHFPVAGQRKYNWYGNTVIAFNGGMKGKLHSILLWKKVWKQLRALKKEEEVIGLFSFFCSECAFIGHYFARWHRLKHHIWVLGQDAKKENKQVKRINPPASELVTISDFLVREFHKNHGIKPEHVIPIGILPELFPQATADRHIDLLAAGSLIPLKRHDLFLDIVSRISKHIPSIQAVICGAGPEYDQLAQQAAQLQLNTVLKMEGNKPHPEMLMLMQRSRILLHPSSYEGFGAVCIEALYAGAHVISFCKPMDAAISNWHIVKDIEEMAAKALSLLEDPSVCYTPQLPYPADESAKQLMALYGYSEEIVS